MNKNLAAEASLKYITGLILFALLTFIPAGTLHYPQGWLLMAILFIPMLGIGIFLLIRNPQLLRKRLNDKETQSEQKKVVLLSMLMFLAVFILAGLNIRFGWYILPMWVSWTAGSRLITMPQIRYILKVLINMSMIISIRTLMRTMVSL